MSEPDHSTLNKFRQWLPPDVRQQAFHFVL